MATTIKQISVYNGSAWETANIGVDASDVTLSSNIAGSTNLQTALSNILPASQLAANKIVTTDANKKLTTVDISSTQLGYLSGTTASIQTQLNNKVAKAGDTMTGNLTINNTGPQIYYKSTNINSAVGKTIPSSGENQQGGIQFIDNQGYNTGWVRQYKNASDNTYIQNVVRRKVGSSDITNSLSLGIKANGSRYVTVSDGDIWRSAIGAQASGNYILSSVSCYNTTNLLTGSSYATIGDVNFYLIGKRICFATFRLVWKANMTAGTSYTIATVANAALRPPTYTTCSTSLGDFTMQEGGSITLRPSQNLTSVTGNMYVDFMYITKANYPS